MFRSTLNQKDVLFSFIAVDCNQKLCGVFGK